MVEVGKNTGKDKLLKQNVKRDEAFMKQMHTKSF